MRPTAAKILTPHGLAGLVLVMGSWLVWAGHSAAIPAMTEPSTVPETLGPWKGKAIPVDQRAIDILETDEVALMEYRQADGPPVWFASVSGFGTRAAFHPPELCYVGSHFEVLERGPITVTVGGKPRRLMRLVIGQGDERFEAWYWFTANGRTTHNYYQQQMWFLGDAIRRNPLAGSLVRISTTLDEPSGTSKRLLAFVNALETATPSAPIP